MIRAKQKDARSESDILADIAGEATKAVPKGAGSVIITVKRVDGGIGIAVGSDLHDVDEIRNLLILTLRKL